MKNKIKIFALYLPQFHTIPENDEWWGKGFTEWTNVKKAKPLFRGHNQPRVPINDYYYNLLNDNTFKCQTDIAKNYGVDGFCFYHYWFNGKLLLEKPLENYLSNKELDFPFFFSWANEPWARTWDGENHNVIMPQKYGGIDDIINHFNYMLPYFRDDRYVKINCKPVFVLYRPNSISYLEDMIITWNKLAKQNGLEGIYFIESLTGYQNDKLSNNTDACFYFEPMWTTHPRNIFHRLVKKIKFKVRGLNLRSYSKTMKQILAKELLSHDRFAGFFVDWDNSPRKGERGTIFIGTSVKVFEHYFIKQLNKMNANNCPWMFINAWNEWGEGTYLEPDKSNGMGFLETIRDVRERLHL